MRKICIKKYIVKHIIIRSIVDIMFSYYSIAFKNVLLIDIKFILYNIFIDKVLIIKP